MTDMQNQQDQPNRLGMALAIGLLATTLLALPAFYNLLVAVQEALTIGLVRVNPTSRGAPRHWVPWQHAWAHFFGLLLLTVGGLPLFLAVASSRFRRLPLSRVGAVVALVAAPIGLPLWVLSGNLTSLSDTLFVCSFFIGVAVVMYVGNKFGRVAAVTLVVVAFIFMSWRAVTVPKRTVEPALKGAVHGGR